mgnify:CR=1 FL=1
MNRRFKSFLALALSALVMAVTAPSVQACAACFGNSDSPMAKAMNWGIMALLVVVCFVLGAFFTLMVYLGRRSVLYAHAVNHETAMARGSMETAVET